MHGPVALKNLFDMNDILICMAHRCGAVSEGKAEAVEPGGVNMPAEPEAEPETKKKIDEDRKTTIIIKVKTRERLAALKMYGETYDDVINKMLEFIDLWADEWSLVD